MFSNQWAKHRVLCGANQQACEPWELRHIIHLNCAGHRHGMRLHSHSPLIHTNLARCIDLGGCQRSRQPQVRSLVTFAHLIRYLLCSVAAACCCCCNLLFMRCRCQHLLHTYARPVMVVFNYIFTTIFFVRCVCVCVRARGQKGSVYRVVCIGSFAHVVVKGDRNVTAAAAAASRSHGNVVVMYILIIIEHALVPSKQ